VKLKKPREGDLDVSLTPLIDAVFLLLVFFLVATMMRKEDKDVDIELPESISAERLPFDDQRFVIAIDSVGNLYIEGTPSTRNHLHAQLRRLAEENPGRQIRLDIDRDTPAHAVVEVVNACQFRGLYNVGIRTYDESYGR
jgi:biopolymer transport protein ExbD